MKRYFLLFLIFNISFLVNAWKGRVVPMSFDKKTNQWNILLGKDTTTGFWSDFFEEAGPGEGENAVAMRALKNQTKGEYNISITR